MRVYTSRRSEKEAGEGTKRNALPWTCEGGRLGHDPPVEAGWVRLRGLKVGPQSVSTFVVTVAVGAVQLVVVSGTEVIPREDKVQGFWPLPRSMMAFHLKDREITLASTLSALILFSPRFAVDSL